MSESVRALLPSGEWTCRTISETFELGVSMGERLRGGEIILLDGPLGAGKTIFTKGLAFALGLDADDITSPSFTLVNHYKEGRLTLYHLDLYRLSAGASAAHAVDLDELLTDEQAVVVIEWAERMGRYPLPAPVWRVSITGDGDEPRRVSISAHDVRGHGDDSSAGDAERTAGRKNFEG
ncbi:MAG TPA: tRNA (adenosine(37)-N6)-threonylcarbamoyltransferase complex ATPase subunit type 1 TsaE [Pyrinomonadaceae bacterium]